MSGVDAALPLTDRQVAFLRLTWEGLTDKAIARRHRLAAKTVHNTMSDAYRRLGLAGRSNPRVAAAVALYRAERGATGEGG